MNSNFKILLLFVGMATGVSLMAQSSMTTTPSRPNTQSGEIVRPTQGGNPAPSNGNTGTSATGQSSSYSRHPDQESDTKGAIGTGKKNMNTKDPKFNGTRVKAHR